MTVARGHDPRRFALVAIGGAGPMHACALADELGIPRVVVPRYPGVAAALGLLATDIRHDLRRSWLRADRRHHAGAAGRRARAAGGRGRRAARAHLGRGHRRLRADLRARHALPRPGLQPDRAASPGGRSPRRDDRRRRARRSRPSTARLYDYTPEVTETEIVTLRVRAPGPHRRRSTGIAAEPPRRQRPPPPARVSPGPAPAAGRVVHARVAAAGRRRSRRSTIVEQEDATVVVPAGWRGRVGAGARSCCSGRRRMSDHVARPDHAGDPGERASTTSPRRWRSSSTARPTRRSSARCSTSTAASSPRTAAWSRTPSRSPRSSA